MLSCFRPKLNQAGTNLRSAHAALISHVISGGNQMEMEEEPLSKEKLCEAWQQEAKVKHEQWRRVQKNNKMTFTELSEWLDQSSKGLKATSAYLLEYQVEVNSQLFKAKIARLPERYHKMAWSLVRCSYFKQSNTMHRS